VNTAIALRQRDAVDAAEGALQAVEDPHAKNVRALTLEDFWTFIRFGDERPEDKLCPVEGNTTQVLTNRVAARLVSRKEPT
jgi:hypothetical protein